MSSSPLLGSALLPYSTKLYLLTNVENFLPKGAKSGIVVDRIHRRKGLLWMATKLSENMSKLIHRMGREREDRIISGKTKLTVAAIFLIDDNWRIFKG